MKQNQDNKLLQAALYYATKYGWAVLPLKPKDKTPITPHGYKDASTDRQQIKAWWTKTPNANIGIACGASNLVVVDVDEPCGPEAWAELCMDNPEWMDDGAVINLTGNGKQYLYTSPHGMSIPNSAGTLGDGLDIRSIGGYIVVPPSIHPNGKTYAWEISAHPEDCAGRPGEAPSPLRAFSVTKSAAPHGSPTPTLPEWILEGRRNDTLTAIAGRLRRSGLDEAPLLAALLVENTARCIPPLPQAEVGRIAKSVAQYPAGTARSGHHLTEMGNADRLLDRRGPDMHFCPELGGWHIWDGKHWKRDRHNMVALWGKDITSELYAEAARAPTKDEREALAKWAIASERAGVHRGLLYWAEFGKGITVPPDEWDIDPYLLNVVNGTMNLKTGTLQDHDRANMLTKLANAHYDPYAVAPKWEQHLARFLPNPNIRRQVQRDLGLGLVGACMDEYLPIWHGLGGNGKSTTALVLQHVLGDYAQRAAPGLLVQRRHEQHPTEIADLRGARLAFSIEIAKQQKLDETKVKELTGGDIKKARLMHQDFFEFPQTFTLVLLCNHLPIIEGTDYAIWRRIRLIPWTVQIAEADRLPQGEVVADLITEADGILCWLLDGLKDWQRDYKWIADEVTKATNEYRQDQDRLSAFLTDCCEIKQFVSVAVKVLYDAYEDWCTTNGQEAIGKRAFGELLRARGIYQKKGAQGARIWNGIRMIATP